MPTVKKARKGATKKACKTRKATCNNLTDGMLQEFVQHKSSVMAIMAGALSLGALFAMMLGVSAASF